MKKFFSIFSLIKNQKKWFFISLVSTIITTLLYTTIFLMMKVFVDIAVEGRTADYIVYLYASAAAILSVSFFEFLRTFSSGKYAENSVRNLRNTLTKKVIHTSFSDLTKFHSGDLVSRVTNDVSQLRQFLSNHFTNLIFVPVMAIIALSYMFSVDYRLTLFTLSMIPIFAFLSSIISLPMKKISKRFQESLADVNSYAQDTIAGYEITKSFNLENIHKKNYEKMIDKSLKNAVNLTKKKSFLHGISLLFNFSPFILCVFFGGYLVSTNQITIGQLLVFINFLNFITNPLQQIPVLMGETKSTIAAVERMKEIFELKEDSFSDNVHLNKKGNVFEIENLNFSYEENTVLENINLKIKKGEKIALVGPSGGGKSTLIKILCGFYKPTNGKIKFFDNDYSDIGINAIRKNISLVTQDTYLYPVSIKENILNGNLESSEKEFLKALQSANLEEFINSLPSKIDTNVGELGSRLSGGQKQRISIARAVIKNAEVMLFDEPTSALDNESEELVQQAIEKSSEGKTSITVAHRLSTIKNVDRILVINKKIVEEGSHEDLMDKKGVYYNLYNKSLKENFIEESEEVLA
jgi:ABC-type multidrug transport system fused ATPase/permease subunit